MSKEEIIKFIEELPLTNSEKKYGKNPIGPIVTFVDDKEEMMPFGRNQYYVPIDDMVDIVKVDDKYFNVVINTETYSDVYRISFCRSIPCY